MPFNPPWLRTPIAALLLMCGVSATAAAEQEVGMPSSPAAQEQAVTADGDVPGLDEGAAVLDRLRVIEEILAAGVAKEAEQALDSLIRQVNTLLMRGAVVFPASYQFAGELWVPAKADTVQVRVEVPEILPRPDREGRRERAEERLVAALRVDWLPLERTGALLTDALQGVRGQGGVPSRSRERLAEALAGIRQTTRLKDPVMEAYRAVKTVLASSDGWQAGGRDELRQAADGLSAADPDDPAARELESLAEAVTPDVGRLALLAAQLRGRVAAGQAPEATPAEPVPEENRTGR